MVLTTRTPHKQLGRPAQSVRQVNAVVPLTHLLWPPLRMSPEVCESDPLRAR